MFQLGLLFPAGMEPYSGGQLEIKEGAEVGHGVREEQEIRVDTPNPIGEVNVDLTNPFGEVNT